MKTKSLALALLPAFTLAACNQAATTTSEPMARPTSQVSPVDASPLPAAVPVPVPAAPPPFTAADRVNDGYPDLAPPVLTPEAEKGVKGARAFLLSFARAIELKEFGQAWAMLSPGDKQKWSKADFAKMFADLGKITVAIPGGTIEGAAGSSYFTSPITVTANDKQGRPVRIEGESVLRRVNDVPGATPAQLRWHFDHLTLDWTH